MTVPLVALQAEVRACTRCVRDGLLAEASPTFSGSAAARFYLVGQAPGPVEFRTRRPFDGRAGKQLWRWMARAGFESDEEFRSLTYIAAMMRCFPGRNRNGSGDRRPSPPEVANCAGWLEAELSILRPLVIVPSAPWRSSASSAPAPSPAEWATASAQHRSSCPSLTPRANPAGSTQAPTESGWRRVSNTCQS